MASNLRVDNIQPTTGTGIGIGTANGSVTFNADVTGGMNIATGDMNITTGGANIATGSLGVGINNPTESKVVIGHTQTSTVKHLAIKDSTNNWVRKLGVDSSNNFGIFDGDTEQLRITNTGNIKFATSGTGIDFSATSDASGMSSEVLDDYEEGSWTPDVTNGGVSWGNQTGHYVKIGKQVTAQFWLQASGTSSSSGGFSIEGLPFASGPYSDRNTGACRAYSLANFTGQSGVMYWMGGTTTSINIVAVNANGLTAAGLLNHNVWQNGAEIHCTIHYQTA